MHIARALLGMIVLLGLATLLSERRRRIDWQLVAGGVGLQILIAALVLGLPAVQTVFQWLSGGIVHILGYSKQGAVFVFGDLANSEKMGFVIAFQVLPTIIFFSAFTSVLYYLGILQTFVYGFAWIMKRLMRLSGAESLATAGNVFLGQTEAPLLVKPYLERMNRSELMALMCGGMATIAGGVMAIYISLLGGDSVESQKQFTKFLLCASLMNAPAALVMAKVLVPQTEEISEVLEIDRSTIGSNLLDALARGTSQGMQLALNVGAMLIVFIAMVAMLNEPIVWLGKVSGLEAVITSASGGVFAQFSLQSICGYLFAPLAWVIGIPGGDLLQVGQLLGMKMVTNEFLAFEQLAAMRVEPGALAERSQSMATFALCGFANLASIGIQLGGIGVLAPSQRGNLALLGFRAMIGGTLASLLSATIAGVFFA